MQKNRRGKYGARSADSLELGAYELPAPGAPEPLSSYIAVGGSDCGCGCKGSGGCGRGAMGDTPTAVVRIGSAAAAYVAYKQAKKSKGMSKWALYAVAAAAAYEATIGF